MAAEIRLMTPEDHERVLRLWKSVPGIGLREYDDGREGFARFLRRNPRTCFAASDGGEIVGTILAGHDGRRGFLYHVAVSPDHQGQGIGRRLTEAAMEALSREGIFKTALVVFADNAGGNEFWEKLGFAARPDLVYRNRENDLSGGTAREQE